jgi:hypothetical protein
MILNEGAKVTQQLINAAFNEPSFKFGFEAEFFVKNIPNVAKAFILKGTSTKEDWITKKLGDITWFDVIQYFFPIDPEKTDITNSEILSYRMRNLYIEEIQEKRAIHSPYHMFELLKRKYPPHQLLAALQMYPEHGFIELNYSQSKALKQMIDESDVEGIKRFGNILNNAHFRIIHSDSVDEIVNPSIDLSSREVIYALIAEGFRNAMNVPVAYASDVSRSYTASGRYTNWVITSDPSLESREQKTEWNMIGVELISPALPLIDGFRYLLKVLDIMNDPKQLGIPGISIHTTVETSLHLNMSIADKDIDYMKLIFLLGDDSVLQRFNRRANQYALSIMKQLKKQTHPLELEKKYTKGQLTSLLNEYFESLKDTISKSDISSFQEYLKNKIPKGKKFSINLNNLDAQGYIEFRAIGNKNYHTRIEDVVMVLQRTAVILYVSTQPEIYKKEFLTKVYKFMIDTLKDADKQKLMASVGTIGMEMGRGYGAPLTNTEKTSYDGENYISKYGIDFEPEMYQ